MVKVGIADSAKNVAVVVVVLSMYDSNALRILTPSYLPENRILNHGAYGYDDFKDTAVVRVPTMMIKKKKKKRIKPRMLTH